MKRSRNTSLIAFNRSDTCISNAFASVFATLMFKAVNKNHINIYNSTELIKWHSQFLHYLYS